MINIQVADLNRPAHAKALLDLLAQYALHPLGGGQALPEYTHKNLVAALLKRTDCMVILAFDDNRAVGLCNCFEGFSTFACKPLLNIHDVFVEQNYRQQSIARQLMQEAEKQARNKGHCKVTLEVLGHNKAAKTCYRACGYAPYQLDEKFGQAEFWQKLIAENN